MQIATKHCLPKSAFRHCHFRQNIHSEPVNAFHSYRHSFNSRCYPLLFVIAAVAAVVDWFLSVVFVFCSFAVLSFDYIYHSTVLLLLSNGPRQFWLTFMAHTVDLKPFMLDECFWELFSYQRFSIEDQAHIDAFLAYRSKASTRYTNYNQFHLSIIRSKFLRNYPKHFQSDYMAHWYLMHKLIVFLLVHTLSHSYASEKWEMLDITFDSCIRWELVTFVHVARPRLYNACNK